MRHFFCSRFTLFSRKAAIALLVTSGFLFVLGASERPLRLVLAEFFLVFEILDGNSFWGKYTRGFCG